MPPPLPYLRYLSNSSISPTSYNEDGGGPVGVCADSNCGEGGNIGAVSTPEDDDELGDGYLRSSGSPVHINIVYLYEVKWKH